MDLYYARNTRKHILKKCITFVFTVFTIVYAQETTNTEGLGTTDVSTIAGDVTVNTDGSHASLMSTTFQSTDDKFADKEMCWNGLGYCDKRCDKQDSNKYEPLCGRFKSCCVPKKIVLDINTLNEIDNNSEEAVVCALNYGKCAAKCLPPTTVYRGSSNECPYRHFCCINANDKQLKIKVLTSL